MLTRAAMWRRLRRAWRRGPACQLEAGRQYTAAFPAAADGWMVLADGLAGVARYREAQTALRRAEKHIARSRMWFVAIQWGHLYREKHDERTAERWYRKAAGAHPSTATHIYLGACLARQGKFAEAKKHHARAIALAENHATDSPDEAHYNLGLILRAEGRYAEAAAEFKAAIRLDPKYRIAKEALRDVNDALHIRGAAEQGDEADQR